MRDTISKAQKGSVGEYAAKLFGQTLFLSGAALAAIVFAAGLLPSGPDNSAVKFYVQLGMYGFAAVLCALGSFYFLAGKFSKKFQARMEKSLCETMRREAAGKKKNKKKGQK